MQELDIPAEADALLRYIEQRGMTPQEACAAMGMAITGLIRDKEEARRFVRLLAKQLDEHHSE
jgi:hypothetical protein